MAYIAFKGRPVALKKKHVSFSGQRLNVRQITLLWDMCFDPAETPFPMETFLGHGCMAVPCCQIAGCMCGNPTTCL